MNFVKSVAPVCIAGLLLVGGIGSAAHAAPGDAVVFTDANLQSCVNGELGQPAGTAVTEAQMSSLSSLNCDGMNVADVEGLQYAPQLTDLNLENNQISDISGLAGMTQLETLFLENNQISDVTGLAGMTELLYLNLTKNQISDVSALTVLTQLPELYLGGNQLNDVSVLAGMTQLAGLDVSENHVVDVSPLAALTQIQLLALNDQTRPQPAATVDTPVPNPVLGTDGSTVAVSDTSLCVDAGCAELVYRTAGTGVNTAWSTDMTVGVATVTFSGALIRDVVTETPAPSDAPTVSGTPVPGVVGTPYDFAFTVVGDPAPTAAITAGVVPDGLIMDAAGIVSGTPTVTGEFPVTVTVTNEWGTASHDTQFTVTDETVVTPPSPETPAPAVTSAPAANLATTGSESTDMLWLAGGGVLLLTIGALAFARARHTQRGPRTQ